MRRRSRGQESSEQGPSPNTPPLHQQRPCTTTVPRFLSPRAHSHLTNTIDSTLPVWKPAGEAVTSTSCPHGTPRGGLVADRPPAPQTTALSFGPGTVPGPQHWAEAVCTVNGVHAPMHPFHPQTSGKAFSSLRPPKNPEWRQEARLSLLPPRLSRHLPLLPSCGLSAVFPGSCLGHEGRGTPPRACTHLGVQPCTLFPASLTHQRPTTHTSAASVHNEHGLGLAHVTPSQRPKAQEQTPSRKRIHRTEPEPATKCPLQEQGTAALVKQTPDPRELPGPFRPVKTQREHAPL